MSDITKETNTITENEFKKYWDYYLILEREILDIEPFVSFHPDNFKCFSNEFIKLYLIICSEIDVICKQFCKYINHMKLVTEKYRNITDYARIILTEHSEITVEKISVSGDIEFSLAPWEEWSVKINDNSRNSSPKWWQKYNDVKHNRTNKDGNNKYNSQYANLQNVLNALSALCILEKYFYADVAKAEAPWGKIPNTVLSPHSRLFGYLDFENYYLTLAGLY